MFFCDLYFLVANNPNLVPNICYISCVCSSCCLLHLFLLFLLHFFHSSCPGKERWPLWVQNQWEAWQDRGWEENDGGVFTFFSVLLHSVCKSVPNMTAFLIGLWDFSIQLLLLDSKNYSFLLPFMTRMLSASLCCWPHFLLVSFKSVHKIAVSKMSWNTLFECAIYIKCFSKDLFIFEISVFMSYIYSFQSNFQCFLYSLFFTTPLEDLCISLSILENVPVETESQRAVSRLLASRGKVLVQVVDSHQL